MAAFVSTAHVRRLSLVALVLGLCAGYGAASMTHLTTTASANPIRRVVTMLQDMQEKIEEEGKGEEKLYHEFMCYCKNGGADLQAAIEAAKVKLAQLATEVKEEQAQKAQLSAAIKTAKGDRLVALKAVDAAKSQLEKQNAQYVKEKTEIEGYIDAFDEAVELLSHQASGGSFLQTHSADRLRQLVRTGVMSDENREVLTSFLAGGEATGGIHTVIGIMSQMKADFEADLDNLKRMNGEVTTDFASLTSSKKREVSALTATAQQKTVRFAEVRTELVNDDEEQDDTQTGLDEDTHFLADLGMECATKKSEWEKRTEMRSQELIALGDAIKMLNDDDALELFKKTLPSTSLLQVQLSSKEVMRKARHALGADRRHDSRLDFISLAMQGKHANFDKVMGMIDDMVALLKKEQNDDDQKKEFCITEFDLADDEQKVLGRTKKKTETDLEKTAEDIESVTSEIEALGIDIQKLDKQVQDATRMRREEHEANKEETATNSAAVDLLKTVKQRLSKFYDSAAAAASFVQLASHRAFEDDSEDSVVPPPPKSFRTLRPKARHAGSVVELINAFISDLNKEITEAKADEKNAQESYEKFVKDAADKRASEKSAMERREALKAQEGETQVKFEEYDRDTLKKMMTQGSYIKDLHKNCDWLVQNHDTRLKARVEEIESLRQAKAVLSGADLSLVEIGSTRRHRAFLA